MIKDMDGNEIKVGDIVLVATKDSHIRRAEIMNIDRDYWIDVKMVVSGRTSSIVANKALLDK